jgi:putative aldouronate transport system permease protein
MVGALLAFKQYNVRLGLFGSPFAGLRYFKQFFNSPQAVRLVQNTLSLSLFQLVLGFPVPIILALALNEVSNKHFKKAVQTITFAPYFISVVVLVALVLQFMAPRSGFIALALQNMGLGGTNLLGDPDAFRPLYVFSSIWQTSGYSAILYIAALSGVDPSLYEAAVIDGASRFKRIISVDLPCIAPTIITLLILESGKIMSVGFEKAYLMQNDMNVTQAEIISTYVYKIGLVNNQVSFSTAVGLFNSVVNLVLILLVNRIAKKVSEVGLW